MKLSFSISVVKALVGVDSLAVIVSVAFVVAVIDVIVAGINVIVVVIVVIVVIVVVVVVVVVGRQNLSLNFSFRGRTWKRILLADCVKKGNCEKNGKKYFASFFCSLC